MKYHSICSILIASVTIITTPLSSATLSFCFEPRAPSAPMVFSRPVKPNPPTKPYCATYGECSQWEIDSYNNDVERYNRDLENYYYERSSFIDELNTYISEANTYAKKVYQYAECEINSLD